MKLYQLSLIGLDVQDIFKRLENPNSIFLLQHKFNYLNARDICVYVRHMIRSKGK